ncbi:MAG: O-antigen ligase family protein [Deltaproteobacteria bacterium]|nr:O-antigen ligase family protein [Deltaproteobacteria bacterium]
MAATPERADGIAAGPPAPGRWLLVTGAALFAIALVAAGAASSRNALLGLGGLAGLVGLGAIVRFAPERACDSLLVLFIALVAIPIDVYLGYVSHTGGWPGFRVSAADVCLYLLVVAVGLGALAGRVENAIPARVLVWMGLLLAQYVVSALRAPDVRLGLFEVAGTVHAFLIAWLVAALFRRELTSWVFALVALQMIVHSGLAAAQGITGRPIGAGWLGGNTELLHEVLRTGATRLRPAGLFAHPIVYATSLVITLPIVTAGLTVARSFALRALCAIALGLGAVGLVLTLSRGAWISNLVAITVLGALALRCRLVDARRIRAIVAVWLVIGVLLGAIFGPRIWERMTRSESGNVEVRFDLNAIALRMVGAHPFFGAGLNNFVETMPPFDPKGVETYFPAPVHNLYLLEAAEAGVPALVLWVGLFASILLMGLHHLPRMHDPLLQWLVAAIVSGLAGLLVTQLADFSHRLEPLRSMVWLDVGLLFGALQANRGRRLAAQHEAGGR